ncbi:Tyrosine-protein phosphatase YwqE [Arenibacter palladensis]|uniref:protein-tyrosine-phosphatase n=1 Tax=Arenibacter palladensis TaxID=237373 RepID=A0A1M5AZU1_9FLAO|nr:CpsB/CapC family capsule biosynthesis tyrosine phosphatase [Arenibacter palladensis]SHF35784.1 Tyrosine-protein phosphatase YwqE [Arenibacter palladensis]
MFYFFQKKKFLVDSLENFIDIHNHILPGIDDGAKTVEDSINLIKGFSDIGVKKFIATPHIMHNYYPNDYETIHAAHGKVQNKLLREDMKDITLDVAAEHMIDANFDHLLDQEKVMPLRNNYLLIEMSYLQPPINFDEAILNIAAHRHFPILAHPERYAFIHQDSSKFQKYKNSGILFQMNILSLSQFYGKDVQKKAHKLLQNGLIDYVASDVHNQQQLQSIKELQLSNNLIKLLYPVIQNTISDFY